ncbi:unnamed protein product [Paramecium pentaurelia]|uniref:CoA transferase n=1 Tax=Paramecium pentaurelia TaxID=43138 RepID=A0A8S1VG73_9CILI|nr:unnamed protein product [Paramecium pentaurelia]
MYKQLKVLDLSRILVGPYATMLLSDLGAQVIKVESFEGDETRKWGPPFFNNQSTYFLSINRSKLSICVDLKKGNQFIKQLVEQSDVLVENFTSGVMDRLGLGYDELSKINPRLIYASVNGFGSNNNQPGFDYIMQAETGFMHITGEKDREPMKVGVAIIDVLTALNLCNGIQGALYQRIHTNRGCHIQTSLYESAIASLVNVSGMYLNGQKDMHRMGNQHPSISPYGTFKIKNKYIVIGVAQDNQFQSLCKILNLNHLINDEKYKENKGRVQNSEKLKRIIEEALENWDVENLINEMKKNKIPVGEVKSVGQCLDSQHSKSLNMVIELENGEKIIRNPLSFSNINLDYPKQAPYLNEHRDEICKQFGINNVDKLIQDGILK